MKLEIEKDIIPVAIHRKTVFIGGLIVASLSYSKTLNRWFLKFKGFSDSVYEMKEEGEAIDIVKNEFFEYLKDLFL